MSVDVYGAGWVTNPGEDKLYYVVKEVARSHACGLFMRETGKKVEDFAMQFVDVLGAMAIAKREKRRIWD